ncbi:MAG: site-specific integrase [Phycisphaerales bacterium]|nr:MAG: site-specific integrase [Phycisphaerales bacterium]
MARIFKVKNTWRLDYIDHNGKRVRRVASTDKDVAQSMLGEALRDVERLKAGLIQADPRDAKRPITDHVREYLRELETCGRNRKYRYNICKRLEKAIADRSWEVVADCTPQSIRDHLGELIADGRTAKTVNQHRADLSAFFRWCVQRGRLAANPCDAVEKIADKREKTRRALSVDEIRVLLESAPSHRALVYLFLVYTGLRRTEAKRLTWSHLHLDGVNPHIELPASITKSGRAERVPLVPQLAEALRAECERTGGNGRVFYAIPEMATFRRDLKRAKIAETDERGRKVVLHSLRHSLATMLASSGVPVAIAQRIMRHRDVRLTAETYTDEGLLPLAASMRGLPDLVNGQGVPHGTDGDRASAETGVPGFVPFDPRKGAQSGMKLSDYQHPDSSQVPRKTGTCATGHTHGKMPCVGLEPTTR